MKKNKTPVFAPLADETISRKEIDETLVEADSQATTSGEVKPEQKKASSTQRYPTIEGYQILDIIGRGGMGVVYRARDLKLDRLVAIKTLLVSRSSKLARERIENEARSLARVNFSGVVQIFEVGHFDEGDVQTPFLVMELVDGPTLENLNDGNPLAPTKAAKIVCQLANTLSACHQTGVVHRDLKPANVLMEHGKFPKLTDFGLARIMETKNRMTRTGEVMGTPGYLSPEQAGGVVEGIAEGTDIYSLGAVLYRLLTGRPPFMAPDPVQAILQVMTLQPAAPRTLQPKVPADLETIALKCLEKKPKHRYESCQQLAEDLQCFLDGRPISAKPTPKHRKAAMWVRRHPTISGACLLFALLIFGAFAGFSMHINRLQDELARSQRIINEGRTLSKWLLDDFNIMLADPRGLTYQRSELADRTQNYLNALLAEASEDRELKTDLAYAFTKLADLQGQIDSSSLGELELAAENLKKADALLQSLGDLDSELAQKVKCLVVSHRCNELLDSQQFDKIPTQLSIIEAILEGDCLIPSEDRILFEAQVATVRFQMARAAADEATMETQLKKIKRICESLIASDADKLRTSTSIAVLAQCYTQWLEPQQRIEELYELLKDGLQQLQDLLAEDPDNQTLQDHVSSLEMFVAETMFRQERFLEANRYYQRTKAHLDRTLLIDAKNQVVLFNVAICNQRLGEVALMMEDLEATERHFANADDCFQKWTTQLNVAPESRSEWLDFRGVQADLSAAQGKLDEASQHIQVKLMGMKKLAKNNAEFQRAYCDALFKSGLISAQISSLEVGKWANGETNDVIGKSEAALEKFNVLLLELKKIDNSLTDSLVEQQIENAQIMIDTMTQQISKIKEIEKQIQSEDL